MKKKSKFLQVLAGVAFVLMLIGILALVFRCTRQEPEEPAPFEIVFDTEAIIA